MKGLIVLYSILHLEQSELIKQMVKNALVEKGFNIDFIPVDTAKSAYEVINSTKVDLIVSSLVIKDDSIENFMKKINKSINRDTPVFIATGSDMTNKSKSIINLGVSNYVSKEAISQEIIKHLESLVYQDELMNYLKEASIAVIDDSHLDQKVLKDILSKYGISKVDCYGSGKDMLSTGKNYDIYIVDAVLKDEFAKTLLLQIRRNNKYSSIIIFSSLTNTKTIASLMESGANDFLSKPMDENIMIAKLKSNIRVNVLLKKYDLK